MLVRPALVVAALGLLLSGCGPAKLNVSRSFTLDPAGTPGQMIELDAIAQNQKITVEFTSSVKDITVLVIKSADMKPDDDMVTVPLKTALAHKQGKEGSFVVEVPAKTATRVIARDAKAKTEVTLKLTNSK